MSLLENSIYSNWILVFSKYICKGDMYLCKIKGKFKGNILNDLEYIKCSFVLHLGNSIYSGHFTVINVFCLRLKSTLDIS